MNTAEQITLNDNAPSVKIVASRSDRLLAVIVERFIIGVFPVLFFLIFGFGFMGGGPSQVTIFVLSFVSAYVLFMVFVSLLFIWKRSQSMGKYFYDIYVVDEKTGKRIGFAKYFFLREFFGRNLLSIVPGYVIVDALMIFTKSRRTLHDRIAGTSVVQLPQEKRRVGFFYFVSLEAVEMKREEVRRRAKKFTLIFFIIAFCISFLVIFFMPASSRSSRDTSFDSYREHLKEAYGLPQ